MFTITITADKSPTLYVPKLDEHYHSVNGALQESIHVFINAGLKQIKKESINILEIGFGTGLNVLLTINESQKNKQKIYYETLEKYPLSDDIIEELQKSELLNSDIFKKIHSAEWEKEINISDNFILRKRQADLIDFMPDKKFDLIYFDAFAPDKQPELWTEEIFIKLYNETNENGILVTYSAKGTVKQALRSAGYLVKRLPGPAGKRHMVQAVKK